MKKNYINVLLIVIMFLGSGLIHSQNIITDGDFSSTTEIIPLDGNILPVNVWASWLNLDTGTEAYPTVVNGVCNYQIINSGSNTWDVQLSQYSFPLIQGHSYRLTFDVRADTDRSFGVYLGEESGNWTNLIGDDKYSNNATTEWQTLSIDFEAFSVFALHKLSFEIGSINTSMYFDNVNLIDLGIQTPPSIGILGSAVNGWIDDIDMTTTDGIYYTLLNYPLIEGEAKFRQDDSWDISWGGDTFPSGVAIPNGPNIPIPYATNYDITFNRWTGEYSFECMIDCPNSIGIIGSALNGWSEDIDMLTTDGITYTLNDYFYNSGEARFRQDDSWDVNWGGDTFPTGIAFLNGPDIPVQEGNYNVTFNRITGDYNFADPNIGILGSALNGWSEDIDMESEDGITYTLNDYFFTSGEAKFRQNDSWNTNWGGDTFPNGFAYWNGPNIPILEGTYNVTFNRLIGEYNFIATTCPNPEVICPEDIYTDNNPGMCGSYVYYPEVLPAPNCGGEGITITQTSGIPSGNWFPIGMTTNSFEITNADGIAATCSFNVFVNDVERPIIMDLNEEYEPLWPPNHQMVEVFIDYEVMDNCPTTTEIIISSNEPENGLGDGDHYPDWEFIDENHVLLRAERSGNGNGREYYITIRVFDSMNFTEEQVIVRVPHNKKKNMRGAVQNEANNNGFVLYPNAADNDIYIKGLSTERKPSYHIYNLYGLLLDHGVLQINKLDISNLPQGMYILRLDTNEGKQSKTFIKN